MNGKPYGDNRGPGQFTNEFLPFANRAGANLLDQDEYEQDPVRETGFEKGLLLSAKTNKVWHQSSFVASGVAQAISNILQEDVLDDGNILYFVAQFIRALQQAGVSVGPTPPTPAMDGALWWDSNSAQMYIMFFDGNSRQWVVANHGTGGGAPALPLTGGVMEGPIDMDGNAILDAFIDGGTY